MAGSCQRSYLALQDELPLLVAQIDVIRRHAGHVIILLFIIILLFSTRPTARTPVHYCLEYTAARWRRRDGPRYCRKSWSGPARDTLSDWGREAPGRRL